MFSLRITHFGIIFVAIHLIYNKQHEDYKRQ
ncbi:hypothetical protein C7379_12310 [Hallella colorans]|uniref:Uncharacterized protein n=1 Tax=Hallella colorans TaxID=1703337 RepID=A0A2U0TYY0_9BACT|nr:hypothetical protein C7379_12310 [Hallella colorans]